MTYSPINCLSSYVRDRQVRQGWSEEEENDPDDFGQDEVCLMKLADAANAGEVHEPSYGVLDTAYRHRGEMLSRPSPAHGPVRPARSSFKERMDKKRLCVPIWMCETMKDLILWWWKNLTLYALRRQWQIYLVDSPVYTVCLCSRNHYSLSKKRAAVTFRPFRSINPEMEF